MGSGRQRAGRAGAAIASVRGALVTALTVAGLLLGGGHEAAQAQDRGMLRIVTDPGNAQIFVDGERRGNSPSDPGQTFAIQLPQGSYVVEALIPSEGPEELYGRQEDVFVSDGTLQTLSLSLAPRPTAAWLAQLDARRVNGVLVPEMVRIPGGSFVMGSPSGEAGRQEDEGPQRTVRIGSFELGRYEVTFEEWDACVADGGCGHRPSDRGWGRGARPVIDVSWRDAQEYVAWLSGRTGQTYRLPTEAEWEYAARAGTTTRWSCGDSESCLDAVAVYTINSNGRTAPVGSKEANAFGLHDMHGNVYEWVQDCYQDSYANAPTDGGAVTGNNSCVRVFRGGSWSLSPRYLRSAYRVRLGPDYRFYYLGFRVARTLP